VPELELPVLDELLVELLLALAPPPPPWPPVPVAVAGW
jgi:hypothetical protein